MEKTHRRHRLLQILFTKLFVSLRDWEKRHTPSHVMLHRVYSVDNVQPPPWPVLLSGITFCTLPSSSFCQNWGEKLLCLSFYTDLKKINPHNDFCFHAVASFLENTTYIGSERPGFGDMSTAWSRKQIDSIRVKNPGLWYKVGWIRDAYIW